MKKIGLVFCLVLFFSTSSHYTVFARNFITQIQKPFNISKHQQNQHYYKYIPQLDSIEEEKFSVITPLDQHREKRREEFSLIQKQTYKSSSTVDANEIFNCNDTALSIAECAENKGTLDYVGESWVKNYSLGGGPGDDYATSIVTDDSGNVYITGSSQDPITSYDYITIKYNSIGEEQWVRRYNGIGNSVDVAYAIKVDNLGNVYVTGKSYSQTTKLDFATVKYNSFGVEQWVSLYNGTGDSDDGAYDLVLDRFGNAYVTGLSYGLATGFDYATVKYDFNGLEDWSVRYNGNSTLNYSNDYAYSLAVDSLANVYVTGYSWGLHDNYDYATVKYSSTGIEQWVKLYNGYHNYNDYACAIVVDNSGNAYVTGTSQGLTTVDDYVTIKYNTDGVMQWSALNNSPGISSDNATDIAIDRLQNVIITGWCFYPSQSSDCVTLKYNSNGTKLWESRYNATGNLRNYSNSLVLDSSGNSYITGTSEFAISGYDYVTVKYNSSGYQQWNIHFADSGNSFDEANSIAVDSFGGVFITGHTTKSGSKIITTIKYTQTPTSVGEIFNDLPVIFFLSQNYPNPFNPSTSIQYAISSTQFVTLKVYDLLGREVATLVNEEKSAGTYNVEFGVKSLELSSGIYFYKLQAGDFVETKKMILLK